MTRDRTTAAPHESLETATRREFLNLLDAERQVIDGSASPDVPPPLIDVSPSGEPCVRSTSDDWVGLALSGGGIRSATFNLGLLQGLQHLNLLRHIDYLSTVSGGGYIGGFLTAWRARGGGKDDKGNDTPATVAFPQPEHTGHRPERVSDTPEIRHLREFSRFLSPRLGLFESAMWHAVLAFLGGLVPTLVATVSLLAFGFATWAWVLARAIDPQAHSSLVATLVGVLMTLVLFEYTWYPKADPKTRADSVAWCVFFSALALVAIAVAYILADEQLRHWPGIIWTKSWIIYINPAFAPLGLDGLLGPPDGTDRRFFIDVPVLRLTIVGVIVSLAALCVRLGMQFLPRNETRTIALNAFERVTMRVLGLALVWSVWAFIWLVGVNVARMGVSTFGSGLVALTSGGILGLLRNWLNNTFRKTADKGRFSRFRKLLPMALAYLAIVSACVWVISVLVHLLHRDPARWGLAVLILAGVLLVFLSVDSAAYSLHGFYRDRIARVVLGAAGSPLGETLAESRSAEVKAGDDMPLVPGAGEARPGPLHLICCAANDLSGDQVGTLSRGSRSATLSRCGLAIGGWLREPAKPITLAEAMTASAAAFNPVMGSVSKRLGPSVTFLLAAFNLRLGLWTRHPAAPEGWRWFFPGRRLFAELFGVTFAGVVVTKDGVRAARADVHLSDGAHFENLGLYELVRRHCRYIVVSDAGADPDVAFDDFGNATRRIREDFGVDIELDLAPLRLDAADRQHAVVGTIHYNRALDKGVIIYFKPTLTGNEATDVLQYHTRNTKFPHESTADQFYDESQWESYRQLGFHSALECFRFVEREQVLISRDRMFTGARHEWYPTKPELRRNVLEMTEHFGQLEQELRVAGQFELLGELFPETGKPVPDPDPEPAAAGSRAVPPSPRHESLTRITLLLRAMQVMEDVWNACDLDREWNHPLNIGWLNAFSRFATAESFVRWWPLLEPNFAPAFQRFMRERYPRLSSDRRTGRVNVVDHIPDGLAKQWWTDRMGLSPRPTPSPGGGVYEYRVALGGLPPLDDVQVALVLIQFSQDKDGVHFAEWTSEDLFVPPSLWGAGIGSDFLPAVIEKLKAIPSPAHGLPAYCQVHVISRQNQREVAHRQERVAFTEFYRRFGFRTVRQADDTPAIIADKATVWDFVTLRHDLRPHDARAAQHHAVKA